MRLNIPRNCQICGEIAPRTEVVARVARDKPEVRRVNCGVSRFPATRDLLKSMCSSLHIFVYRLS